RDIGRLQGPSRRGVRIADVGDVTISGLQQAVRAVVKHVGPVDVGDLGEGLVGYAKVVGTAALMHYTLQVVFMAGEQGNAVGPGREATHRINKLVGTLLRGSGTIAARIEPLIK